MFSERRGKTGLARDFAQNIILEFQEDEEKHCFRDTCPVQLDQFWLRLEELGGWMDNLPQSPKIELTKSHCSIYGEKYMGIPYYV